MGPIMALSQLTQEEVRGIFRYNRRDGLLIRKFTVGAARAGTSSQCKDRDGYLVVGINGRLYRAHRVIWLYVYGDWPLNDCDHINRVKDDNRIKNLRDVTRSQNKQNMLACKSNKCGIKGVYWSERYERWMAEIGHQGKQIRIGQYKTIKEAADAYAATAANLHEFNPCAKHQG